MKFVSCAAVLGVSSVLASVSLGSEPSDNQEQTQCTEDVVNAECFTSPFAWTANTCCGQLTSSSVGECRTRDVVVPSNVLSSSKVSVKMTVGYESVASSESCAARVCTVFGDPEGIPFGSTKLDSYIPCDGRIESGKKQCRMDEDTCKSRRGPDGGACIWRPEAGQDWAVADRGSPCVSAVDPTISVYKISDVLEITAKVGERGIITAVTVSDLESPEAYMTAESCFLNPAETASQLPGSAVTALSGTGTVRTYAVALSCGSFELKCIKMLTTGAVDGQQYRIDLDKITIHQSAAQIAAAGHTESGFCADGTFDKGEFYDVGVSDPEAFMHLHSTCVNKNLPTISACRHFGSELCTHHEVRDVAMEWCEANAADITCGKFKRLGASARVKKCKADLGMEADREVAGEPSTPRWANYFACTQFPSSSRSQKKLAGCISTLGWAECVAELDDDSGTNAVCQKEVCIGHEDPKTGKFVSAMCATEEQSGEAVTLTKAKYPALFKNLANAKVTQCGLSAACISSSSAPVPGIDVMVEFESPDQEPESCSMDNAFETPAVCDTGATDEVALGSCETQCDVENLCGTCRTLKMGGAYCDPADDSDAGRLACEKLSEKGGRLDIAIVRDEAASEISCCKTCQAWGDPYFAAFDGSVLDQLLCDGRKKVGKHQCEVKKDMCESKVDHAGNACVFSPGRAALLAKLRPADIGVVGSACQPDYDAPNTWAPNVTLFELTDVKVNIITGERSIISEVNFAIDGAETKLIAKECFDTDFSDLASSGVAIFTDEAVCPNGASKCGGRTTERRVLVAAADKGLIMELRCIRGFAGDDDLEGGWRFNVEDLTSTDMARVGDSTGLCNAPGPFKQKWTELAVTAADQDEACGELADSLTTTCKTIYDNTCTANHFVEAITNWCADAKLSAGDRVACKKKIIAPGFGSLKAQRKARKQWINFFCKQLGPSDQKACKKDYTQFLSAVGTAVAPCASSVADYKKLDRSDCDTGVSIKYVSPESGELLEALFVSDKLPMCAGAKLSFDADKYPELFTNEIVLENCGMDATLCPLLGNVDAHCAPSYGFQANMKFSRDVSFCSDQV